MEKVIVSVLVFIVVGFVAFAIFSVQVKPAEVAIKVDMYGGDKGVQTETLKTGRTFYNAITHDVIKYPIYIQQKDYNGIQFQDVDGLILSADVAVAYKFKEDKVAVLYEQYRKQPSSITKEYFPTWIRNAMVNESSTMKVDEIYGVRKEEFRSNVKMALQKDFEEKGIIIEDIYFINGIQIPEAVKSRIDDKVKANQIAEQKKNELEATKADVEKQVAVEEGKARSRIIESESRAEEIENLNVSLSPAYLEFKALEIKNKAIEKWNGVQPTVVGSEGLILDIGAIK